MRGHVGRILRHWTVALGVAGSGAALVGCSERLPTYRYELSVQVDTPEGRRVGSSVTEVRTVIGRPFPNPGVIAERFVTAEATVVPLPNGEHLFALVSPEVIGPISNRIAPPDDVEADPGGWDNLRETVRRLATGKYQARVPPNVYPMLIRFRDRRDPATAEEVKPNDLGAAFGPGYRLAGMTVRTTNKPPTRKLINHLPWLVRGQGQRPLMPTLWDGRPASELTEVQQLTFHSFIQGN